jgi:hypothetical protein
LVPPANSTQTTTLANLNTLGSLLSAFTTVADDHLDRQMFGWLYPLIEFNWIEHTTTASLDLPARRGFFDLNNFESSGNILTMAVGANVVLIPAKLEFGAVYLTSIAAQHDFNVVGLMVKMVYRY